MKITEIQDILFEAASTLEDLKGIIDFRHRLVDELAAAALALPAVFDSAVTAAAGVQGAD